MLINSNYDCYLLCFLLFFLFSKTFKNWKEVIQGHNIQGATISCAKVLSHSSFLFSLQGAILVSSGILLSKFAYIFQVDSVKNDEEK